MNSHRWTLHPPFLFEPFFLPGAFIQLFWPGQPDKRLGFRSNQGYYTYVSSFPSDTVPVGTRGLFRIGQTLAPQREGTDIMSTAGPIESTATN
jgi:hypothetical protein